jgi:TatA/E family protein of Tat protein translocase
MIIALLLFGRRLPEVARNLGKGVVEFKKGLKGIDDDIEHSSTSHSNKSSAAPGPAYGGGSAEQQVGSQGNSAPAGSEAPKS